MICTLTIVIDFPHTEKIVFFPIGCPCADCSVQRNNLLSERTCSAGDVRFFGTANLITQRPGPQIFAQQNATYVSTHLTFPCSGYIQRVEIQAKGDESLQNVTLDLHLWRIQNSTNSTLLFQQVKRFTMNFNVTFNSPRYIVLSANISERNQSQFHFYEGDILGFTIPVNSPVNVTSSTPEEPGCPVGKNMTYLLSGNCTPADSSSVCDMPRIGITFGEFPIYILKNVNARHCYFLYLFLAPPSGSPSFSAPLLTSSPTPSPSFSVLPSLPSPTSSPAGVSQMTPEPMSPTSSQPTNIIFIILGAVLGSIACTVLITAMIILVIYILQRRTPSTKWTHSNESEFKSSSTKTMH